MALTAIIVLAALIFVVVCYALQCAFHIAIIVLDLLLNIEIHHDD